ncbi:MAG: phosphotransferase [Alphaproteobacteria bacterium]|nr:phosphotransferase [Alphaproteobacteria bacterium]
MDAARARVLVDRAWPSLASLPLQPAGAGWDNVVWRLGDALSVRFAQRALGGTLLLQESRWLPGLAEALPLPVSTPLDTIAATHDHPLPYALCRWVAGTTACRVDVPDAAWPDLARALAAFLRALHDVPVPDDAPGDTIGRQDWPRSVARMPALVAELDGVDADLARAALERITAHVDLPPDDGPRRWVHGDLYARHVTLDGGDAPGRPLRIAGVIDWGDLHAGDTALDLSMAWGWLPPEVHATFLDAYGPVDDATWARARQRATVHGALVLHYGVVAHDDALRTAGRRALHHTVHGRSAPAALLALPAGSGYPTSPPDGGAE